MSEQSRRASESDVPIPWSDSLAEARAQAVARRRPLMVYFSGSPGCGESLALEAVGFTDARVVGFIRERLVALHVDPARNRALAERYEITATPVVVLTDASGRVYGRIEGNPPSEELRLRLALGVLACEGALADLPPVRRVAPTPPARPREPAQPARADAEFAAESLYWNAASRFRRTGDRRSLHLDWQTIATRFPHTVWARRMRLVDDTTQQSS
ncbi:MAG TPA: thioredoxin fold domain-containing protein [Planctomycetota bacterium]|nr:thioredoxin fold domain-containing protein [Planctomycetota bacterium]